MRRFQAQSHTLCGCSCFLMSPILAAFPHTRAALKKRSEMIKICNSIAASSPSERCAG